MRVALCALLLTLVAQAREPKRQAREAYAAGLRHYQGGEYQQAAALFKRAYEIEPVPYLLFNMAQAYRLQRDYVHAVEVYRSYLRELPGAPNRGDVEVLIASSSARLPQDLPVPRLEAPPSIAVPPPQVAPPAPPVVAPPLAAPMKRPHARGELIAGLALVAVGMAGVAAGAYFAARESSDAESLARLRASHGAWDARAQASWDDGGTSATAATALFTAGALTAVTGSVLAIVGGRSRGWQVTPLRAGAAAVWTCAF